MTFLDTSAIVDYLAADDDVIDYLEGRTPFFTSTICVFEVLNGKAGSGSADMSQHRADFSGVTALDLTEEIAVEAARMQDDLMSDGVRISPMDAMIAGTARSTGDELVSSDADFDVAPLKEYMDVTNLG